MARLTRQIPEEVLVGYHFCYGTFPEWPMYEARDMGLLVRMANYAIANSGRAVDWLHLAGPRYLRSEDESFFEPLSELEVGDARVYLGDRAAAGRRSRAAAPPCDRVEVPGGFRGGDVLRLRPPARAPMGPRRCASMPASCARCGASSVVASTLPVSSGTACTTSHSSALRATVRTFATWDVINVPS